MLLSGGRGYEFESRRWLGLHLFAVQDDLRSVVLFFAEIGIFAQRGRSALARAYEHSHADNELRKWPFFVSYLTCSLGRV